VEVRQAYLDYLNSRLRLRAGLLKVDWIESLSPITNDLFWARDLRNGAFDENQQPLIPVLGFDLNHSLLGGNLEWLVVALPRSSRLPKGDNGYGLFPFLSQLAGSPAFQFTERPIPQHAEETEAGLRFSRTVSEIDLSGFVYAGHQRLPSLEILPGTVPRIEASFPRVVTWGLAGSFAQDAWVARAYSYFEPGRGPRVSFVTPDLLETKETLVRVGGGFDYLFSKHLKLYSDFNLSRWTLTRTSTGGTNRRISNEAAVSVRLTNETLRRLTFSLDVTATFPQSSLFLSPKAIVDLSRTLRLTVGGCLIESSSPQSPLETIKAASQLSLTLEWFFSMR
jgi:hypothetical protein